MTENHTANPTPALAFSDQNLVWLDCEMSGLDPERERLLEIAIVITDPQLQTRVEGPVLVIHQSDELLAGMDAWNRGTHGRSGLTDKVRASTLTEGEAEQQLIAFILVTSKSSAKVVCASITKSAPETTIRTITAGKTAAGNCSVRTTPKRTKQPKPAANKPIVFQAACRRTVKAA